MNLVARWLVRAGRRLRHARWLTLSAVLWLAVAGTALGQKKKKDEPAAAPTKSYVASYFIVMLALSGGLFAALRPSSRLDKVPEKIIDDEE